MEKVPLFTYVHFLLKVSRETLNERDRNFLGHASRFPRKLWALGSVNCYLPFEDSVFTG